MYQNSINTSYTLYNDQSSVLTSDYKLYFGRISYALAKLELIEVTNHNGDNNYGGAKFVHGFRFYYWGQTNKIYLSST